MENKKGLGLVGLVVLCLAVSALFGIAYATFSQTLQISGSASVSANTWKIAWSAMADNSSTTAMTVPTITADGTQTSITGWAGSFSKYGDTVSFTVTAKNYGTLAAHLASVTDGSGTALTSSTYKNLITCTSNYSDATRAQEEAGYVKSDLTFTITKGQTDVATYAGSNADSLTPGTGTETYTFTLTYNQSDQTDTIGDKLPKGTVTCSVATMNFNYEQ